MRARGAPIDLSPWRLRAGSAVATALGAAVVLTPMAAQASDAEASVAPADSGASTPPSTLSDEGFAHLVGQRLRLAVVDGDPVIGLLTAVEPGQVSFACEPDDDVVEIATSRIIGVRLLAPRPPLVETSGSRELRAEDMRSPKLWSAGFATTMVGGTALFAFGVGAVIHARTATSSCDSFLGCYGATSRTHAWLPLAFGGGALIAAGIPMWIVGGSDPRVEPAIAPTPVTGRGRGAHGSLRFEF